MRRLDSRVGVPLCFLLTVIRRFFGRRGGHVSGGPRRILVLKFAEQGATVAAHQALRRAVDLVGLENVHVAVFAENRFILDELGIIDHHRVLVVHTNSVGRFGWDVLMLVRRARRLGVDAVVDLEFFSRLTAIVSFLTGARIRTGLHSFSGEGPYRGDLLTHRLSANPVQHVSRTFLSLVEATTVDPDLLPALDLGTSPGTQPPRTVVGDDERRHVLDLIARAVDPGAFDGKFVGGIDGARIVLLNPNSGDLVPLRRWPTERYVALADRLLAAHPDVMVVITGGPSEAADAGAVAAAVGSPRCVSLAGATTMRDLLVLYELSEVLVTNDSGPAHYAGLTSVDVVVLFGPETPMVFGPLGDRTHVLWAGLACSPCVNVFNNRLSPCHDNLCMQHITVDQVHDTVEEILVSRDAPGSR